MKVAICLDLDKIPSEDKQLIRMAVRLLERDVIGIYLLEDLKDGD